MKMPRCFVKNKDGSVDEGILWDRRATESTVRFEVAPYQDRGKLGRETFNYSYRDIPNIYIALENE